MKNKLKRLKNRIIYAWYVLTSSNYYCFVLKGSSVRANGQTKTSIEGAESFYEAMEEIVEDLHDRLLHAKALIPGNLETQEDHDDIQN